MNKPAKTHPTGKRGGKTKTSWKPGQSGNPKGRPATGESWTELIKKIGDMSPAAAAQHCKAIMGQLDSIGNNVTLKEAVVLRVYASLLFEPQPGLFNAFMERTEGKVPDKLQVMDWRDDAKSVGVDPDALAAELFAKVRPVEAGEDD